MEFSFTDLMKRFWHYAWLIILLIIVFAGAGFAYSKTGKETNYSASRSVVVAKDNSGVFDPNSRFMADKALIPTYEKVAQDDAVVSAAKKALPFEMSKSEISGAISIKNETDTLVLDFQASGSSTYRAKALANEYAKAFVEVGPTIYPDMGKLDLLSAVSAGNASTVSAKSAKKLTVFGSVLGLVAGFFIVLVSGIYENYQQAKKQG